MRAIVMRVLNSLILTSVLSGSLTGCSAQPIETYDSVQQAEAQQLWTESCKDWDDWDKAGPPYRIHANSYYVGTCGISAILITGADGHILIDGGTEAAPDVIAKNIAAVGFSLSDVKILLHSHEHFDHVAGLARLQELSSASLYASKAAAPVLSSGVTAASDPQNGSHDPFPPADVTHIIENGTPLHLGDIRLTALETPGHTEGALSWQWQSCEGGACEWIVYADSLSPVSRFDYRFSEHLTYLSNYKSSLQYLRDVDCTLVITPHPSASQMRRRLADGQLTNPLGCVEYSEGISGKLEKRLRKEEADK